ncbi:c-type cytochrome [Roseimaritima ulvae]|uniref:Cytochrome c-550 n=1 Tax=Roseimaritima ulvae TaxID=980254 RepID=A0A5B9QL11_9BACT|nr:c-type cytochrome [Roseimaritima ulvae]QEG38240.1 Cytochrome c-550 [Roseimaritima ulvae]
MFAFVCSEAPAQTLSENLKAEGVAVLAKAAREKGDAVRGAILFPQAKLACAKCHIAGQHKLAPDLTALAADTTDEHLVEALLFPSKTIRKGFESVSALTVGGEIHTGHILSETDDLLILSSGSTEPKQIKLQQEDIEEVVPNKTSIMPDDLVDQLANRQQLLDLVKYLIEIKATGTTQPALAATLDSPQPSLSDELQGLVWLDAFNCHACHQRGSLPTVAAPQHAPRLAWGSGKIDPQYIERFIADPQAVKPGTQMPDLMASLDEDSRRTTARQITHYLVSLGDTAFHRQPLDAEAAHRGEALFHSVGCVACHSPRDAHGKETLPEDSISLDTPADKYNLDGLVEFLEDPHAARPGGRMPNLKLTHWEAIDIANYLLSPADISADAPSHAPFQLDRKLAAAGRRQFDRLGCNQCHPQGGPRGRRDFPALAAAVADKGCLSKSIGPWPRYTLDAEQRSQIQAAIEQAPENLNDQQQIAVTLTALNCIACHQRDGQGGVSNLRDAYFQTANPNLGPQGRIPPRLTGIGAKLQPKWMRQVLVSGRSSRPYMHTRMPQYGADNVAHLVDLFQRVDQLPDVSHGDFDDAKEARKSGHEMVGSKGLNCVACHNFRQKPASTMPALDLTEMGERLHKDWFYHYMRDPQRFNPGTVMPTFWPGGQAMRKDILDGDTSQQLEALWLYLEEGRQARVPQGLVRKPIELLAGDEAVMLRRSYQSIGKRGIGVGYPAGVNLAYDAEQMRIGMIWKGKFANPGGVWGSQGHGTVQPLGHDLVRFEPGPELDSASEPWPVDDGRPPTHHFKGYTLDELQRPTFMYRYNDIEVTDFPHDAPADGPDTSRILRTLTFSSPQPHADVVFRLASAADIRNDETHPGSFLIGDKLRLHIDDAHQGRILETPTGKQLQIPLTIGPEKTTLQLEYIW